MSKRLLPEVLPDPTRRGAGDPRQRVREHLSRLWQVAATTAGAAGAAACAGYGVVDPLPPPARCEDLHSPSNGIPRLTVTLPAAWQSGGVSGAVSVTTFDLYGVTLSVKDATVDTGSVATHVSPGETEGFTIDFVLTPAANAMAAAVVLEVSCVPQYGAGSSATASWRLDFDLSGPRTDGSPVPVNVTALP